MKNFGAKMKAKASNNNASQVAGAAEELSYKIDFKRNDWKIQEVAVSEFKEQAIADILNY